MIRQAIGLFLVFVFATAAYAVDYNKPHRKWYRSETTHFNVTYLSGLQEQALLGASIAEEVYGYFRDDYGFELPKKMEIIFDDEDYSNGWAWASANTIKIWISGLDFELRGFNDWLRNVVVHEFAHIVSIQHAQKSRYNIPDIRFGYSDYFNERIQTNFFTLYSFDLFPMWFAEGIAQFEASRRGSDSWDTHRDMLMRVKSLNDKLLPIGQMNIFIGKSKDFESGPYNQGFSLVRYISDTYGYGSIKRICDECRKIKNLTFDMALRSALGFGTDSLYREWGLAEKGRYNKDLQAIGSITEGRRLWSDSSNDYGFRNIHPLWSNDGRELFFLSNSGGDGGRASLYKWSFSDTIKKEKERFKLHSPIVTGFFSILDSGRKVAHSSPHIAPVSGETYIDAVIDTVVGTGTLENMRNTLSFLRKDSLGLLRNRFRFNITFRDHIQQAVASSNGLWVAAVRKVKNKNELVLLQNNNIVSVKSFSRITAPLLGVEWVQKRRQKIDRLLFKDPSNSANGFLIQGPRFSPNDSLIVFSYFDNHSMNIGLVDLNGNFRQIVDSDYDDRDPSFTPDGKSIVFSSDRSGIFNLYRVDIETGNCTRITNVVGGAFQPVVSPDGASIAYSGYDTAGFSIYITENTPLANETLFDINSRRDKTKPASPSIVSFSYEPVPYSVKLNRALIIPMILGEELTSSGANAEKGKIGIKAGGICWLTDPLEKHSLLALGLLEVSNGIDIIGSDYGRHLFFNPSHDKEMMLIYENKLFYPTLSIALAKFLIADTGSFYNSSEYRYAMDKYLIDVQEYLADASFPFFSTNRFFRLGLRYGSQSVDFYNMDGFSFEYSFYKSINPFVQFVTTTFGSGVDGWRQEDAIDPRGSSFRLRFEHSTDDILVDGSSWQESFTIGDGGKIIEKYKRSNHNRLTLSYGAAFAAPFLPSLTIGGEAYLTAADRPIDNFLYPGLMMTTMPFLENSSRLFFPGRNGGRAAAFIRFPMWKRLRVRAGNLLFDKAYASLFFEAGASSGIDPSWQGRADLSEYSRQNREIDKYVARLPQNQNETRFPVEFNSYADMEDSIQKVEASKINYRFPSEDKHVVYKELPDDTVNGFIANMMSIFRAMPRTGLGAELRFENYISPGYPLFVTLRYSTALSRGEEMASLNRFVSTKPWNNPDAMLYLNVGFSFDSWITDRDPEYGVVSRVGDFSRNRALSTVPYKSLR